MKRNVRNILFAFAAAALSCVMASCSHSSDSDDEETPGPGNVTGGVTTRSISEKESVTFNVETNSTDAENTNIVFTYDRSAAGAKEKITIKNCNIEIAVNGEAKTVTELNFILNEYGDYTGDKATQYQCKIPVGKKLSAGDTVTVTFKSKNGDFSGEGESTAKIDTLTVSLIDNAETANWYKELVANDLEYQPLFNKEGSSNNGNPVTPPAGDEGNTGSVVLFESETGWSEDWQTKEFKDVTKFANATNDSYLAFTVSKDTDRLIKENENDDNKYSECYAIIQMLDYSVENGKFGKGTSNTTVENENQLNLRGANGLFEDSDINTTFKKVTYKPTAEEWTKIKASGLGIQAHGTMFKKIEIIIK